MLIASALLLSACGNGEGELQDANGSRGGDDQTTAAPSATTGDTRGGEQQDELDEIRGGTWHDPVAVGQSVQVGAWEISFGETSTEVDGTSVTRILQDLGYLGLATDDLTYARAYVTAKLVGDDFWDFDEYGPEDEGAFKLILDGLEVHFGSGDYMESIHAMTDNLSADSLHQRWPTDELAIGDVIKGHVTVRVFDELENSRWVVTAEKYDPEAPDAGESGVIESDPVYFAAVPERGGSGDTPSEPNDPPEDVAAVLDWRIELGEVIRGEAVNDLMASAYGEDLRLGQLSPEYEYIAIALEAASLNGEHTGTLSENVDIQLVSTMTGEKAADSPAFLTRTVSGDIRSEMALDETDIDDAEYQTHLVYLANTGALRAGGELVLTDATGAERFEPARLSIELP